MHKINNKKILVGKFKRGNRNFAWVNVYKETTNEILKKIYIDKKYTKFALDGDDVLVKIIKDETYNKSAEGEVVSIIRHNNDLIVGTFTKKKDFGFVVPLDKKISFDIHINGKNIGSIPNDMIVLCKLIFQQKQKKNPEGKIIKIIGNVNDPNAQINAIFDNYNIPYIFSEEALNESKKIPQVIEGNDLQNRVDLRNKITFTIDGDDTKDFDDAISIEKNDDFTTTLFVSIADVAHFVKENSYIDKEAKKRGNSIYYLNKVIPMLPFELSNGVCSLNENEDRLALTCQIKFDNNANVIDAKIYESVINNNMRMTYKEVHKVLSDDSDINEKYITYKNILKDMYDLSTKIRKKRENAGCIDFDIEESKIIVDDNMKPLDIRPYEIYESNKMIEDFMVSANESVAKIFYNMHIPFVYRIHEKPDIEKNKNLLYVLSNLGVYNQKSDFDLSSKDYQKILLNIKDIDYKIAVQTIVLRNMNQAKYSPDELGHFALSLDYYSHFTSPIRRYADLQIHRIIKEVLNKKLDNKRILHYKNILPQVCEDISLSERKAIDIERDIDNLKKCEFMNERIGEVFDGFISNVTNFGLFVKLYNTVEGLVLLREMAEDYYIYDENKLEIIGEKTKLKFRIGTKVKVKLINVSIENREIDFKLVKGKNNEVNSK